MCWAEWSSRPSAPPPADAKIVGGEARRKCPISDHQFMVAAAEQVSIESVQEQVRALLDGRIVVGFAITNDLKVLDGKGYASAF